MGGNGNRIFLGGWPVGEKIPPGGRMGIPMDPHGDQWGQTIFWGVAYRGENSPGDRMGIPMDPHGGQWRQSILGGGLSVRNFPLGDAWGFPWICSVYKSDAADE